MTLRKIIVERRRQEIWAEHLKDPSVPYIRLAEKFGISASSASQDIRVMHTRTHGIPPEPRTRPIPAGEEAPPSLNPRVKDPDAMWAEAYKKGLLC